MIHTILWNITITILVIFSVLNSRDSYTIICYIYKISELIINEQLNLLHLAYWLRKEKPSKHWAN